MRNNFSVQVRLLLILLMAFVAIPIAKCQLPDDSIFKLIAPLPDVLLCEDGHIVESAEEWESKRRDEVLELFRSVVYGRIPLSEPLVSYEVIFQDKQALEGKAVMKEVKVTVRNGERQMNFNILVFLPTGSEGTVPLFLGLNFIGNHTIHPSTEISISSSWVENKPELGITENRATEQSRGARASRWPVELILDRGYGLATIFYGDIDPDFHDGFKNGIHGVLQEKTTVRTPDSWGSIAGWAWALSRAMDYLKTDPAVDQNRVAVIGHSRLGKTSLWAGALDQRFALVVSNNSGCGGAALSRRPFGESVSRINSIFPHWFAEKFHEYGDNEVACPVDQHMLLSLIAPRPLYVASALEDEWADPYGEYLSLLNSGSVYSLYEKEKLKKKLSPEVDQPRWVGKQGYHIRSGKHDITTYDWKLYLDFADLHFNEKQ